MSKTTIARPPRDDLFRALFPGVRMRAAAVTDTGMDAATGRTLFGHFAVFDTWTEIDSMWEGNFLERLAPGSFRKTLKERGDQIRCLFQHGYDFVVGDKPLGPFTELREDGEGLYYEVPLLDTQYNAELIPGLEAGLYGASFRFRVMREEMVQEPGVSAYNPKGLPERTIKELTLFEGGPVTFGAYPEATAGMRSVTDEFMVERMARHPERLREIVEARAKRVGGPLEERVDSEDIGTLGTMLALATAYIEDQDEPDDGAEAPLIVAMQSIQTSLIDLLAIEAAESEPDEPEDEEASTAPPGVVREDTPESREQEQEAHKAPAVKATPKVTKDYLSESLAPPWYL